MDRYIIKNGKNLRMGYTTGTCAAIASKAACKMLLTGERVESATIDTPAGISVTADINDIIMEHDSVSCAVIKDAGDDPDVTDGMAIYAMAEKCDRGVIIKGGKGIGIVTKPGLDQPVGEYAINSTPRRIITETVQALMAGYKYDGGVMLTISAPEGEETAKKTFNPRMGIEGGISIIGTTGIVEPMSNDAIISTTRLEIRQRKAKGDEILYLAPGRIGERFAKDELGIDADSCTLCSNNIGEAFDAALEAGFKDIWLIGHVGKLVKLGYGARNTHSTNNDGRMEELVFCGLKAGASVECLSKVSECVTCDGAFALFSEEHKADKVMEILGERICDTVRRWVKDVKVTIICFTSAEADGKYHRFEI
ncbi:MAG: cobalt-precorrin-5B (C(1))-methyltransferase CbiD [Lachnospiraceae bacterium]|nr:cobalt-precorrin-5B (C(1))-methyltransferase CbiD [Lachnospiraceae bacterium]